MAVWNAIEIRGLTKQYGSLTAEQQEAVNEFWNVVDNPYPWEELKE